jgi:hypothetical protein
MNATIELIKIKTDLTLHENKIMETEILDILGNELPEINEELERLPNAQNIYTTVKCFAEYTKQLINKGNLSEVKHCFNVAEKMLTSGNKVVKNAIENVYIFSISSILDFASPLSNKIKGMMNRRLLSEYKRQVCASGI